MMQPLAEQSSTVVQRQCVGGSLSDRRAHPRYPGNDLWWIHSTRLKYGGAVSLVALSASGALIETDFQLQPDSSQILELLALSGPAAVPLQVLRCHAALIRGKLRYRGACAFKQVLELPEALVAPAVIGRGQQSPIRLDRALKSLLEFCERPTLPAKSAIEDGQQIVDMLKRLQARAARASSHGSDAIVGLMLDVTAELERGARWSEAQERIQDKLRQTLPHFKIAVVDTLSPIAEERIESIHFSLACPGAGPAQYLNIEMPHDYRLEDEDFRILKAASHLITMLRIWDNREVGDSTAALMKPDQHRRSTPPQAPRRGARSSVPRFVEYV